MTRSDFEVLANFLHGLYGERFPLFTPGMRDLWYDDLQALDATLVQRGAKRWARHHTLKAPSLDELRESVELVQEQDLRARLPQKAVDPLATVQAMYQQAHEADPDYTHVDEVFAKLMFRLIAHARGERLPRFSLADCAAMCLTWAAKYRSQSAELAADLEYEAVLYEREAAKQGPRYAPARTGLSLPALGESRAVVPLPVCDRDLPCLHAQVNSAGTACMDCGEVLTQEAVGD